MPRELTVRGGKILLWRLGNLEFSDQKYWGDRVPKGENCGMWAFPHPYFDIFFAYHKYVNALPKRFQTTQRGFPLHNLAQYYEVVDEPSGEYRSPNSIEQEFLHNWLQKTKSESYHDAEYTDFPDNFAVSEKYELEKNEWITKVGRKVVPLRKFYYEGGLYSRLGEQRHDENWTYMSSSEFIREVKRARGVASVGREIISWRTEELGFRKRNNHYSMDHLEIFIPQGAGKISGKIARK